MDLSPSPEFKPRLGSIFIILLLKQETRIARSTVDERRNVGFHRPPHPGTPAFHTSSALTRNKRLFPMLNAGYHTPNQICQQEYLKGKIAVAPLLFVGMAVLTACAGVVLAMAVDATFHGGYVGCPSHNIHLADLAVAHFAFHASL
jgi:hypothetical protein